MSDYGDYDRDDDSYARSSRDRRRSPHDDRGSHRSSHRRSSKPSSKDMASIGKKAAEKSGGLFSPEDWMCKSCGNINWARRTTCNMCNMPKYQKTEARTGAGGGYNERDNVEYNERHEESDGEYDEFGRKKKKFRSITKDSDEISSNRIQNPSKSKSQSLAEDEEEEEEDDDDDDDDDEFDAKKYALDSEDDDNEEKNHKQASSSKSNKKSSSSDEHRNSRSSSSSADDRHSSENRKSHQHDQPSSSSNHRRSNSPNSSKRRDNYHERRRSRSRSPISPTNRTHQRSSRH